MEKMMCTAKKFQTCTMDESFLGPMSLWTKILLGLISLGQRSIWTTVLWTNIATPKDETISIDNNT